MLLGLLLLSDPHFIAHYSTKKSTIPSLKIFCSQHCFWLRNKNPVLTRGRLGSMLFVSTELYHYYLLLDTSYLTLAKCLIVPAFRDVQDFSLSYDPLNL